ncbi:hypothetical protein C900_04366 [Fulvivirga imtechensis AK7]|uniref:Uncharacterized protein n=1 Tax=Fulvivirga imtechensis AK7 TaxID=1237149 RepID=L8K0R3_9BACT|nr:hypothetical protein C900_04366 [Fulvivirga imtechensis AK7]
MVISCKKLPSDPSGAAFFIDSSFGNKKTGVIRPASARIYSGLPWKRRKLKYN